MRRGREAALFCGVVPWPFEQGDDTARSLNYPGGSVVGQVSPAVFFRIRITAIMNRGKQRVMTSAIVVLAAVLPLCAADLTLSGRVVDENEAPVHDARVTLRSSAQSWESTSGPDGEFTFLLPGGGDFVLSVERQGYYPLKDRPLHLENSQELTLAISAVREVFQSVNVAETPSSLDITQTNNTESLTATEVNDVPYSNDHSLRSSFLMIPGVLQDSSGAIHVNGASQNQVTYLLNGFNIANPVSGQLQSVFAIEGVRSVDLSSGRYSPQYGNGSAGVLAITTDSGTDHFHYTATDFLPGLSFQEGPHLGNWYPRFGLSGPILRGRAWFSDNLDLEYNKSVIFGLPSGQNTRSGAALGNLLHGQVNLNKSNILFGDFLINLDHEGRVGLGALSPVSTTQTVDTREYFFSVKDQAYLGRGVLVEFGFAHNDFWTGQIPQGQNLYVISPVGQSGNYFVDANQTATRDEGMVHIFFPQLHWLGTHQFETGGAGDLRRENGDYHRTGYLVLGDQDQILSETVFPTPAVFHVSDTEFSTYLLDTWRVSRRFQLTMGVRADQDQRISATGWSPRAAFSWSPFSNNHTRISGGYAVTHDQVTLDVLSRPLDQVAETTEYNSYGVVEGPPVPTTFVIGNAPLALPEASNWTLNVDHQIAGHIYLTVKYLRRRGTDGFAYINMLDPNAAPSLLPLPSGEAAGVYQLTSLRRDDYDSGQFALRQTFKGQHEWMVSYTRSRALTNALIDPNSPQPLQILPYFTAMPWDAPNRLLAWAYLPFPIRRWSKNWSIAVLSDMRTGYPFSIREPSGPVIGIVDSFRYPLNFDLNLAIERMITLHGYRFALRGGVVNLTNQANPTAVNNVTGVPQFLQFAGDQGRHFVVRLRFFGHQKGN